MESLDTHRDKQTHSQTNTGLITHTHTSSHRHISNRNTHREKDPHIPTESHTQTQRHPQRQRERETHRHTRACTRKNDPGRDRQEERKDYEGSHSTQSTLTIGLWQHHNRLQGDMSPSKLIETRQNSSEIVDIASARLCFLRNNVRIWFVKWW